MARYLCLLYLQLNDLCGKIRRNLGHPDVAAQQRQLTVDAGALASALLPRSTTFRRAERARFEQCLLVHVLCLLLRVDARRYDNRFANLIGGGWWWNDRRRRNRCDERGQRCECAAAAAAGVRWAAVGVAGG